MRLLAVDLGLRAGLACWDQRDGLLWYRSQNFGSVARMRRALTKVVREIDRIEHIILEGDRGLGAHWERAASYAGADFLYVAPETWRPALMPARARRSGPDAKKSADQLARKIISDSPQAKNPTSLRHDAAEAVLIARWAAGHLGWVPPGA